MTDAGKKHLYDVADLFLYFAEKAKREGLLALDDVVDADTMRIQEFDGDERIEFPELSDDEHFAFSLLLGGIVNGTDSEIIAGIAENLLESTGNTTALRLGMEAIRDIQSGVPPAAMELKIYAMMGREIALEYKQHRQDMEFMGPVRVSDVEAAQAHFVRIAERLGGR